MPHPNGRKPPSPTRVPKVNGRRPPPPPPHSSRGKDGCAIIALGALGALVTIGYGIKEIVS